MTRRIPILILAAVSNLALVITLHAGPGDIDTSFAGTGSARAAFGFGEDLGFAAAVQPDGKLVVAGSSGIVGYFGGNFSVVRYDTNGVLDNSFGESGKVITPVLGSNNIISQAKTVQIQTDGKIVLAGNAYDGTNTVFAVVRYRPDGSLDGSFGEGGITTTDFGRFAEGNAMAIQPDGKIVVVGSSYDAFNGGFSLARYTTNGALDITFGGAGKFITELNNGNARAYALALQPDGKLVVAGVISPDMAVFRYTTNGVLDTSFGAAHTGKVFTHIGAPDAFSEADAVAIQPGNGTAQDPDKIIVAGSSEASPSHYVFTVVRYGLDGLPDGTFGVGGVATSAIGPGDGFGDFVTAVLVQGTGLQSRRIIVAGFTRFGASDIFCLARFNGSGTLDLSFDGDGRVLTSFGPNDSQARAMTLAPGGKLVVVGSNRTGPGNSDFALARYNLADGSPDASFGNDGLMLQDVADRTASASSVAVQSDGKLVLAGSCFNGANNSFALTRFNQDGTLDASFGNFGRAIVSFRGSNSAANAVLIQPDGRIIAAGYSENDFAVTRLNANGTLDLTFDGDGMVTTSFAAGADVARAIALQPDGKIVVAGSSFNGINNDFAVVRYTTNGTPDITFDGDGKVTTAIDAGDDAAAAVKIQSDGRIVVGGYGVVAGSADFAAVRYTTNGSLDTSFGTFGRAATPLGSAAVGLAMAIQPDGKILMAGYTLIGADLDFGIVRYNTNGTPDSSFDGDGKVTTAIGLGADLAASIALQADGKILVAGAATLGSRTRPAFVRYLANGALDDSYGTGGKAVVEFSDDAFSSATAIALDAMGRVVIAGDDNGFFGVARLEGDAGMRILSITRLSNGHAFLTGVGVPNASHTVQSSANLVAGNFVPLGSVTNDIAGHWQYEDASAANFSSRFYRLGFP